MPIYEFHCPACENDFETLVMNSRATVSCPRCGGHDLERKLSVFAFQSGGKFNSSVAGKGCSHCGNPGGCANCH
ncbi:MAG: zinc ribbon domain-containing protein [Candidatus Tectomicrobia bacterium]|uniref:Zinc ribbon domain-containing protein n=1 Tax=Tectimicrobiota bacterium TaxID=2528274 RepID=A0A932GS86_UNCTE|nr:zinc ribbon domain-containing protein [Candidatus Tectomicrobia bacterium]